MLIGLFCTIFLLVLVKVFTSHCERSTSDFVFHVFSKFCGQTRDRTLSTVSLKILFLTCALLIFFFFTFNGSVLFSILATERRDIFENYNSLNESGRDIYISRPILELYGDVPELQKFRNLKVIGPDELYQMLTHNNMDKIFLVEESSVLTSTSAERMNLHRMTHKFGE